MTFSEQWFPVSQAQFDIRSWDGEDHAVVYVVANGDTHLLDSLALELLRLIQVSPGSKERLADRFAELLPSEAYDTVLTYVEATLHRLLDVGLVSRMPS